MENGRKSFHQAMGSPKLWKVKPGSTQTRRSEDCLTFGCAFNFLQLCLKPGPGEKKIQNPHVLRFVEESAQLCQPDRIVYCNGSAEERAALTREAVSSGVLIELNQSKRPGCYFHRSNPNDVARVEALTFICAPTREEAGPTNNWVPPKEMYDVLRSITRRCDARPDTLRDSVSDGPPGIALTKVGIEMTDSIYVVLNMRIMTRMGAGRLRATRQRATISIAGLHSMLDVNPDAPIHRPFPAGQHDHLRRLELRWQRAAREKMPGAAHRLVSRPQRRLDGGAHAHSRRRIAGRVKRRMWPRLSPAPAERRISPCSFRRPFQGLEDPDGG